MPADHSESNSEPAPGLPSGELRRLAAEGEAARGKLVSTVNFLGDQAHAAILDMPPRMRDSREECRVLDWVTAASVPEWPTAARAHPFQPRFPASPETLTSGPGARRIARPETRVFTLGQLQPVGGGTPYLVWVRES